MFVGVKVYCLVVSPLSSTVSFNHLYADTVSPPRVVSQVNVVAAPLFTAAGPVIPVILAAAEILCILLCE